MLWIGNGIDVSWNRDFGVFHVVSMNELRFGFRSVVLQVLDSLEIRSVCVVWVRLWNLGQGSWDLHFVECGSWHSRHYDVF